jgi:hypothetical protein
MKASTFELAHDQAKQPKDLLEAGPLKSLVSDVLEYLPATNIPSEDRFARVSHHHDKHTRACRISTVAASHVLTEMQGLHSCALHALSQRRDTTHTTAAAATLAGPYSSAWRAFVAAEPHSGDLSFKSAAWLQMTDEEKSLFQKVGRRKGCRGHRQSILNPRPFVL